MKIRTVIAAMLTLCATTLAVTFALAQESNPDRDAYFGETHVRTSWSADAYLFGNHLTGPAEDGPTPFIYITAYDDPEARAGAEAAGCAAYFRKSDSGDEVLEAIRRCAKLGE